MMNHGIGSMARGMAASFIAPDRTVDEAVHVLHLRPLLEAQALTTPPQGKEGTA
jgi:hypothetical protein